MDVIYNDLGKMKVYFLEIIGQKKMNLSHYRHFISRKRT